MKQTTAFSLLRHADEAALRRIAEDFPPVLDDEAVFARSMAKYRGEVSPAPRRRHLKMFGAVLTAAAAVFAGVFFLRHPQTPPSELIVPTSETTTAAASQSREAVTETVSETVTEMVTEQTSPEPGTSSEIITTSEIVSSVPEIVFTTESTETSKVPETSSTSKETAAVPAIVTAKESTSVQTEPTTESSTSAVTTTATEPPQSITESATLATSATQVSATDPTTAPQSETFTTMLTSESLETAKTDPPDIPETTSTQVMTTGTESAIKLPGFIVSADGTVTVQAQENDTPNWNMQHVPEGMTLVAWRGNGLIPGEQLLGIPDPDAPGELVTFTAVQKIRPSFCLQTSTAFRLTAVTVLGYPGFTAVSGDKPILCFDDGEYVYLVCDYPDALIDD